MRNYLQQSRIIELESLSEPVRNRSFTISSLLGSGASCAAYRAADTENIPVVIKECFPFSKVNRNNDGSIVWNGIDAEKRALDKFRLSFNTQLDIQNTEDLMNTSAQLIDGLYSGNNTLYTVTNLQNVDTYNNVKDNSLKDIFQTAKAIAIAIGKYHNHGYLHLDIKPDNILIYPETREMVRLIDFDSIIKIDDTTDRDISLSYTHDYAAPELLQKKRKRISVVTDIYSIGAVVFSRILGRVPTSEDRGVFSDWDLMNNVYFTGMGNRICRLTKDFFHKTLSSSAIKRYQNTNELIDALNSLIEATCIVPVLTNYSIRPEPSFICRDTELTQIANALTSNNYIILEGIRGIGKTEIAKGYAFIRKSDYDCIQLLTFNNSIKQTIAESLELHNYNASDYEEDSIYNEKMDIIRENKSRNRCLIIIDNFNVTQDDNFKDLISLDNEFFHFIFTSTFEHSKHNVLLINELKEDGQLLSLFYEYYESKLSKEDEAIVLETLELVLRHTMTVILIALQMKNGRKKPTEMRDSLQSGLDQKLLTKLLVNKEGLSASENEKTMFDHLKTLFDLSDIHSNEAFMHIMTNMAILSPVGIKTKDFYDWVLAKQYEGEDYSDLNCLINNKWILYNREEDIISLHPVISELAYSELKPDSKNCHSLMVGVLKRNKLISEENYIVRLNYKKMVDFICERINDTSRIKIGLLILQAETNLNFSKINQSVEQAEKLFNLIIKNRDKNSSKPDSLKFWNNRLTQVEFVLGQSYLVLGKFDDALKHYLNLYDREDDVSAKCSILSQIMHLHYCLGDSKSAQEYLSLARNIIEESGCNDSLGAKLVDFQEFIIFGMFNEQNKENSQDKNYIIEPDFKADTRLINYVQSYMIYIDNFEIGKALNICLDANKFCEDYFGAESYMTGYFLQITGFVYNIIYQACKSFDEDPDDEDEFNDFMISNNIAIEQSNYFKEQALSYYNSAMETYKTIFPHNHRAISDTQDLINEISI